MERDVKAETFVKVEVLAPIGSEYLCSIDTRHVDENTIIVFEKEGKRYLLESTGDGRTFISKRDALKITIEEIYELLGRYECYVRVHKPKKIPLFYIG